jgi:hypothetical protein
MYEFKMHEFTSSDHHSDSEQYHLKNPAEYPAQYSNSYT